MSLGSGGSGSSLRGRRVRRADWPGAAGFAPQALLGALDCGESPPLDEAAALRAPVLPPAHACVDAWLTDGPLHSGHTGRVRWQHNGEWMFGVLDLDESALGQDLQTLAREAYLDVFAALAASPCPQLLRLWNYLPDINAEQAGLERYRQFNIGRQQAFLVAGQAAFEGAPAACALGTRRGPLSVRFLAGRVAPLAIENPRQVPAYRYPNEYGPSSPSFSRAALFDAGGGQVALMISGTASIVGHDSRHPGDVGAQTEETLRNLEALIDAARRRTDAAWALRELCATVYVRCADDAPAVHAALTRVLGSDSPCLQSLVLLQADVCRQELLVEIEAHGLAPGRMAAREDAPVTEDAR
jgi:chorismate lyase / 3-hydroxybenzoate synthase